MLNKVECKNCQAAEEVMSIEKGYHLYVCHRRSSAEQLVPLYHWCYEGVYRYGDKDK